MSREYIVRAEDTDPPAYREQWLNGPGYLIESGVERPTITVNVMNGDQWVRETVDLTPMIERWVRDIRKDLKKQ